MNIRNVLNGLKNTIFSFLGYVNQHQMALSFLHINVVRRHAFESMHNFVCNKYILYYMFLAAECYVEMQFDNSSFRVAAIVHPSTYLNKVLFASHQGALQLWNVHSNKLLYTFSGWGTSITALEQVTAFFLSHFK